MDGFKEEYEFFEEVECVECGEKYAVAYSSDCEAIIFCPMCGTEAGGDIDIDDADERDKADDDTEGDA